MSSIRKANSAVIVGLPGIGKSTVARLMTDREREIWRDHLADMGKIYHFAHIDYSFKPSYQEVMRQIGRELAKQSLSIAVGGDSFEALDSLFADQDLSAHHFVLVFDGYDEVSNEQAKALLNRLRQLRNRQMNMSFLFVSRREPQNLYEIDELIDTVYYLGPLSERDQRATIERHERRLGCSFNVEQRNWLLDYCGGLPGFMKYMCDLLCDRKILTEEDVISACLAERRIRQICQDIWVDLSEREKARLIEVAKGQSLELDDKLNQQLKKRHLLNRQGQVFAEIFKGYILSLQEPHPAVCTWQMRLFELLITAAGKELGIGLTHKEAELLSVLMKKSPAVVSLDDIQQTLWPESACKPGEVVDPARLTKLISRVRLRVDSVMQQHGLLSTQDRSIENVRGQGYRLNPKIRVKKD